MKRSFPFLIGGLLVTVALVVASPWASDSPDGLERVAIDEGFADTETEHGLGDSPLADYETRGVSDERLSKPVAGLVGLAATFGIGLLLFGAMRLRRKAPEPAEAA